MNDFDIIVIGGGMVGSAVACRLAQQGKRVVLIESQRPQPFDSSQLIDLRVSAISPASQDLLTKLGAWELIETMRLCPYRELHTWEEDALTHLKFTAAEVGRDYLGYMVENRVIQLALWSRCETLGVMIIESDNWLFAQDAQRVTLTTNEQVFTASLIIGADGANSKVRQLAGIGIKGWDYGQHCMVINVQLDAIQQEVTWQKFFPSGPRALLPLPNRQAALIWYDDRHTIERLSQLAPLLLKSEIIKAFPKLAGDIELQRYASFALTRRHALRYFQGRVVLLGDAAHTINPLAGQGVNLGFKDVQSLTSSLANADLSHDVESYLQTYQSQRRKDNLMMQTVMDLFYQVFSTKLLGAKRLRSMALHVAQYGGPVKRKLLHYAMGLR